MKKGLRITLIGKVQGVGFRFYTHKKAQELHLCGWVKNLRDGSVAIEAEGEAQDLDIFVDWCHQGTQWSHVKKVLSQEIPVQNLEKFIVK